MNAVGLDLSYSRSGFCQIWSDSDTGTVRVRTEKFKTLPEVPLIVRTGQIKEWVFDQLFKTELDGHLAIIVIESAVFGGKRAGMLGGLSMAILLSVFEHYVDRGATNLLLVPPPTLKKSAGVKGKAKPLMVAAFKELNPDFDRVCNDEADAYFLARLGAAYTTAAHGGTIPALARDVLFNEQLNKSGKPRGLALRTGDFFYKGTGHAV